MLNHRVISTARLPGYPQMQHSGHNPEEALSGAFSIHSFQHCPVEFSVMMEISCICVIQCGSHGIQYVLFLRVSTKHMKYG